MDAPPAVTADILPLAAYIDGVIVLVRQRRTEGKDIDKLHHRLEQVGVPIIGGVLIRRRRLVRDYRHGGRPAAPASRHVTETTEPSAVGQTAEPEADADLTIRLPAVSQFSAKPATPDESVKQPR